MTSPNITPSEAARIIGRLGGFARRRKLTKKQRSDSARKAAIAGVKARKRKAANGKAI
jgi:hypothetical protein